MADVMVQIGLYWSYVVLQLFRFCAVGDTYCSVLGVASRVFIFQCLLLASLAAAEVSSLLEKPDAHTPQKGSKVHVAGA